VSIKRFLARQGAVGSTARWAAKGYWNYKNQTPDATIDEICRELINVRYSSPNLIEAREGLLNLLSEGHIKGLASLVIDILTIEAGFRENSADTRALFIEVTREELRRLDVPETDIHRMPF
jgi:hypothetical protein